MKFGAVPTVEGLDLSLPPDHPDTARLMESGKRKGPVQIHVGCAQWNKKDLKNFYPKGTKDELGYYATQFNAIELNATFYRQFSPAQFTEWSKKVPEGFRFFPAVVQAISHVAGLNGAEAMVDDYVHALRHLGHSLGAAFLQMPESFSPADGALLEPFLRYWPKNLPLAVEFRHTDWYTIAVVAEQLYEVLEKHRAMNIILDTAGRRDLLHMRLTTPSAFIRFVGTNDPRSDRARLDEWVVRLKTWVELGIEEVDFFVHHNGGLASPLLAAEFIRNLNNALGTELNVPNTRME